MTSPLDDLERAIASAQQQLKFMWVLRLRMMRLAQAALIGAAASTAATVIFSGLLVWFATRSIYTPPISELVMAAALMLVLLSLGGFFWLKRVDCINAAQALEVEIETVRLELNHAIDVLRREVDTVNGQ